MSARIYVEPGKAIRGFADRLSIGGEEFLDLDLRSGDGSAVNGRWQAVVYQTNSTRHARLADGNAIAGIAFDWTDASQAFATVDLLDDFAPARTAISSLAQTAAESDVFSDQPFRRAVAMPALFSKLELPSLDWCCLDDRRMAAARFDERGEKIIPVRGADSLIRFCAECHQTSERFPPNFLYGSTEQVAANLESCAPRIFYRLHMWQMPNAARAKTPMPPEHALPGLNFDSEHWKNSDELSGLKSAAAEILRSGSDSPDRILATRYENLRPCLGAQ